MLPPQRVQRSWRSFASVPCSELRPSPRPRTRAMGCRGSTEATQQPYDAPHPSIGQTSRKIGHGGALSSLGQGRIRYYDTSKGADVQLLADRERPGRDQLAGGRAHDGAAENPAAMVGDRLDVARGRALGLGAVVLMVG